MPQIFICYSTEDKIFAEQVHTCLMREGIDVFMAGIALRPGVRWDAEILKALNSSEAIFFLASEASIASPYVQQELGAALNAGKRIIPIIWNIEPERLPGFLRNIQALDLRHSNSPDAFTARLSALGLAIVAETKEVAARPGGGLTLETALAIAAVLLVAYLLLSAAKG